MIVSLTVYNIDGSVKQTLRRRPTFDGYNGDYADYCLNTFRLKTIMLSVISYDILGREVVTIDEEGLQTVIDYDDYGRQIGMHYFSEKGRNTSYGRV